MLVTGWDLFFLVVLMTLTSCSKRSIPSELEPKYVPAAKRLKSEKEDGLIVVSNLPDRFFEEYFLDDLFINIAVQLLETIHYRPAENPFLSLHSVSRHWNGVLRSLQFASFLQAHPKTAFKLILAKPAGFLHLLPGLLDLPDLPFYQSEAKKLIKGAPDVETLQKLSLLPCFANCRGAITTLDAKWYNDDYLELYDANLVDLTYFPDLSGEEARKDPVGAVSKLYITFRESADFYLGRIPLKDLVLMAFIDDLSHPWQLTWIYFFFMNQITRFIRHPEHGLVVQEICKILSQIVLPKSTTLLWECVQLPCLLAILLDDRSFIASLHLDFYLISAHHHSHITQAFIQVTKDFMDSNKPLDPTDVLNKASGAIDGVTSWNNVHGFDHEALKVIFTAFQQDPRGIRAVKRQLRFHLP